MYCQTHSIFLFPLIFVRFKPLFVGALSKDDEIWDNIDTEAESNWGELRKKWKCTLVDFGFARALMPDDCSKQLRSENRRASFMDIGNSGSERISSSGRISSSSRRSSTGRMSISHKIHHRLSGTLEVYV